MDIVNKKNNKKASKNCIKKEDLYLLLPWILDFIKNNLKYGYFPIRKFLHLLLRCPNGRQTRILGRFIYHGTKKNTPNRSRYRFKNGRSK